MAQTKGGGVMGEETKWLIGLLTGGVLTIGGVMIAAFNRLADRITRGDEVLHSRINDVREEYVRRSDLDGHLTRVDVQFRELKTEIREQHRDTQQRLDRVLSAVRQKNPERED